MSNISDNQDIRDALLQLSKDIQSLRQEVKDLSRKPRFSKGQIQLRTNTSDRMIQGAIWVIIATAVVSVVSNFTAILLESLSTRTP
ncbi:MAG: hypothetical protein ACTS2F_17105 [Thainema sp.]